MILQLIPLIALCCVLQRNRKPSHPSRHVVGAVLKDLFFFSKKKEFKRQKILKIEKVGENFATFLTAAKPRVCEKVFWISSEK